MIQHARSSTLTFFVFGAILTAILLCSGLLAIVYVSVRRVQERNESYAVTDPTREQSDQEALDWYNEGVAYYDAGAFEPAIECFTRVIELNPHHVDALKNRAFAFASKGETHRAIDDFTTCLRIDPGNAADYYNNRGNCWRNLGEHEKAIDDFTAAIAIAPDDASPYANRAETYNELARYDEAIVDATAAIRLDRSNHGAYFERGLAHHSRADYAAAIADFSTAIKCQPKTALYLRGRGQAYNESGQNELAMVDYDEAVRLEPTNPEVYYDRGNARYAMKQYDAAIKDYSATIRHDPHDSNAYSNRGAMREHKAEYTNAIADYRAALDIDPENPHAVINLAQALAIYPVDEIRDGEEAIALVLTLFDSSVFPECDLNDILASAYAEAGQFDKAIAAQVKAVDLAPEDEKDDYSERLELYRAGVPYRMSADDED